MEENDVFIDKGQVLCDVQGLVHEGCYRWKDVQQVVPGLGLDANT